MMKERDRHVDRKGAIVKSGLRNRMNAMMIGPSDHELTILNPKSVYLMELFMEETHNSGEIENEW
jgi:hypothetical protein